MHFSDTPTQFQTPEVKFGNEHDLTDNFYINDQFLPEICEIARQKILLSILGKVYWLLCRNSPAAHPIIKFSIYILFEAGHYA